jgi:hypothetical protein
VSIGRAIQFTEEFIKRKTVGLRNVFQRAEACQVTAHAGGSSRNEDSGQVLAIFMETLGYG